SLAILPTVPSGFRFDPRGRHLFTFANAVHRWPVRFDQDTLHLGPPESMGQGAIGFALDETGGRAIFGRLGPGAIVIDFDKPESAPRHLAHPAAIHVDLSPDGRWAATGNHNGAGAKVWDATSGRLDRNLLTEVGNVRVWFRPDGKQLVTASQDGLIFWETGTWQEQRRIPTSGEAAVAWDAGGKLLAFTPSRYHVELQDAAAGRAVAMLEAPADLQVPMMALTRPETGLPSGRAGRRTFVSGTCSCYAAGSRRWGSTGRCRGTSRPRRKPIRPFGLKSTRA